MSSKDWADQNNYIAIFNDLNSRPLKIKPVIGNRVIVASGLVGRGHEWIREEATIIEVASSAIKVKFGDGTANIKWVHPALILEIL